MYRFTVVSTQDSLFYLVLLFIYSCITYSYYLSSHCYYFVSLLTMYLLGNEGWSLNNCTPTFARAWTLADMAAASGPALPHNAGRKQQRKGQ